VSLRLVAALFTLTLSFTSSLFAQDLAPPPPFLTDVGIDQRLGEQVPLELSFRNDAGRTVQLKDLVRDRPAILMLVYYECPMLCTMSLNDLTAALRMVPFTPGKEFDIITVSFDPREQPALAAAKKQSYLHQYKRPEAATGWHFLVGDEQPIRQLTQAVGFRYTWDDATQQFAHASGFMILTPEGKLARYFYGHAYAPSDLRLSLVEASQGRIGSPADVVLLYCFHYDPARGKYSLAIMNILRALGTLTVIVLVGYIARSVIRERRAAAATTTAAEAEALSAGSSERT
jgi:protein SCO1/2